MMRIFRCSRDFHGARRVRGAGERRQVGATAAVSLPGTAGRPTLNQPFETTLLARFPHLLHGNGLYTGNEHFAPFISIRQTGTVRAVDTKCSRDRGGGDVLKVVQAEGVVELARWQIPEGDTRYYCLIASKLKIIFRLLKRQI